MKLSFVSTRSISDAMRYQMLRMQSDLAKADKELSTGRLADVGAVLGVRTSQSVSLARDLNRLNGLVDSNAAIASRLSASQQALDQLGGVAQDFFAAITANSSSGTDPSVLQAEARDALQTMVGILNSSLNGEYLFSGINTDVKPLNVYEAGSPGKTAFDAACLGHFGFTQTDPAASGITEADMQTFLDTQVAPLYTGAAWQSGWSNATDQRIVSRITLNETVETSVSANISGIQKLANAAATVQELLQGQLNGATQDIVVQSAFKLVGEAIADLTREQAELGIVQTRVTSASERIKLQVDLFTNNIRDLEGVDPYEASTRISSLMTQIETSYTLTARIQQLSLVRYL